MEKLWKNYGSVKVSNYGDVISKRLKREVGWKNSDGYSKVSSIVKGKRITWSVHRLVYYLFGSDYNIDLEVNHKDGIKSNNAIFNLEMVTHAENIKHAWDNNLMRHTKKGLENIRQASIKGVVCIQTEEVFKSMTDAAKQYSISKSAISANIKGNQLSAGKHKQNKRKLTWKLTN